MRRLQDKFKFRYEDSQERATAQLRGIPPLSGRIVWARQIENQLSTLMKRMEDVLGAGWEEHFEGKQLKEVCEELRGYLDPERLYKVWREEQLRADYRSYNRLKEFILLVEEDPISMRKFIRVNFEQSHVELFKEVRYLDWLLPTLSQSSNSIPASIRGVAKEAYARYPVAVTLQAALSSFINAKKYMTEENSMLLISYIEPVREAINEAMGGTKRTQRWVKWDSPELQEWVVRLSSRVNEFQDRVYDLKEKVTRVEQQLKQLETVIYDRKPLEDAIMSLQLVVDEMQRKNFANMQLWVETLDRKVESIICNRLKGAVDTWSRSFVGNDSFPGRVDLYQTVHEIALASQILSLSPPIEQARVEWISNFHTYLSIVSTLPRLVSGRGNVVFGITSSGPKDYTNTMQLLGSSVLQAAYGTIEDHLARADQYTQKWLQYQGLWDVSVGTIAEKLGQDIGAWQQLLTEIRQARTTIESSEEEKVFGPIVINYRQVQNKINLKYDIWQKELQARFAIILGDEIKSMHTELVTSKTRLESVYLEGPTRDVINGVEFILKSQAAIAGTKKKVMNLESSEKLLQKQRFKFPEEWVPSSNVTGVLSDLEQILQRRSSAMDSQLPLLQQKIKEEDQAISQRSQEFVALWQAQRPVNGNAAPSEALQVVANFEEQVRRLTESIERVRGAKLALGIEFTPDNTMAGFLEEVSNLREAWTAVSPTWDKLAALRNSPMKGLVPTKIRKQVLSYRIVLKSTNFAIIISKFHRQIEELNEELKAVPSKFRSYACVQVFQETLQKNIAMQPVLRDLCSEALKERHWRPLLRTMGISEGISSLTLGILWESNLQAHRKSITETLAVAQGELALEQFLRDTKEYWQTAELQLVVRDNSRAITGWDVLFGALEDHLNSLASLKQSPYFRNVQEFQEETMNWESRLTLLRAIFDVWVEVQRKWLYLRGIFRSADIKAQLPAQFTRFKGVESEFSGLMKKVGAKPGVLDLLQIENLLRLLERQVQ